MKKKLHISLIILLALLFVACNPEEEVKLGIGSIQINLNGIKTANEYVFSYEGPETNTITLNDTNTLYLANITEGKYTFKVEAKYNGESVGVGSGEFNVEALKNSTQTVDLTITKAIVPVSLDNVPEDVTKTVLTVHDAETNEELKTVEANETVFVLDNGSYVFRAKSYIGDILVSNVSLGITEISVKENDPVKMVFNFISASVRLHCSRYDGNNYKLFFKDPGSSEYYLYSTNRYGDFVVDGLHSGEYNYKILAYMDDQLIGHSEEQTFLIDSNESKNIEVSMLQDKIKLTVSVSNHPFDYRIEEIVVYSLDGEVCNRHEGNSNSSFWIEPGDYKIQYKAYSYNNVLMGESEIKDISVVVGDGNNFNLEYKSIFAAKEFEITNILEADRYVLNYNGAIRGSLEFNGNNTGCISSLPAGQYYYDVYAYVGNVEVGRILNQSFQVDSVNSTKTYVTLEQTRYKTHISIVNAPVENCQHFLRVYNNRSSYYPQVFKTSDVFVWLEPGSYRIEYSCTRDSFEIGKTNTETIEVRFGWENDFEFEYIEILGSVKLTNSDCRDGNKIVLTYKGPISGEVTVESRGYGSYDIQGLPVGEYTYTLREFRDDIEIGVKSDESSFLITDSQSNSVSYSTKLIRNKLIYNVQGIPYGMKEHKITIFKEDGTLVKTAVAGNQGFEYLDFGRYYVEFDSYLSGVHKGHVKSEIIDVAETQIASVNMSYTSVRGYLVFDFNAMPCVDRVEISYTSGYNTTRIELSPALNEYRYLPLGTFKYNVQAFYKNMLVGSAVNESINIETDKGYQINTDFILQDKGIIELNVTNNNGKYEKASLLVGDSVLGTSSISDDGIARFIVNAGVYENLKVKVLDYYSQTVNFEVIATPVEVSSQALAKCDVTMSRELCDLTLNINNIINTYNTNKNTSNIKTEYLIEVIDEAGKRHEAKVNDVNEVLLTGVLEGLIKVNVKVTQDSGSTNIINNPTFEFALSKENCKFDIALDYSIDLIEYTLPSGYEYKDFVDYVYISYYLDDSNDNLYIHFHNFKWNPKIYIPRAAVASIDSVESTQKELGLWLHHNYRTMTTYKIPFTQPVSNISFEKAEYNDNDASVWLNLPNNIPEIYSNLRCVVDNAYSYVGNSTRESWISINLINQKPGDPMTEYIAKLYGTPKSGGSEVEIGQFTFKAKYDYPGQLFQYDLGEVINGVFTGTLRK